MKPKDLEIVHDAIEKHGDDFWNGHDSEEQARGQKHWNGTLFDEVVSFLNKEGLDLKVVKLKKGGVNVCS